MNILVVDDDGVTRSALKTLLGREGHRVSTAGNTESASRLVDAEQFDAALVDLELGGNDDSNAFVRGLPRRTRVYRITGKPDEVPDDVRGLRVFPKPLDIAELTQTLGAFA